MDGMRNGKRKSGSVLLLFLCWLVYTAGYLGKVNFAANITQIIDFYGVSKAEAGAVPSFLFFAYGCGQVVNGLLCKKYNVKWMVFAGLFVSASVNFVLALAPDFAVVKWLWALNGFMLSLLWPNLIRLLSETLPQNRLATSAVVMGTPVALGTLAVYGTSSLFALFEKFEYSFYLAAASGMAISVLWLLLFRRATEGAMREKSAEERAVSESGEPTLSGRKTPSRTLFFLSLGLLCFFAVGINLIKDGLSTWLPAILKEEFSYSDSLSILLTLFLPALATFANPFALWVHKKIPDYVLHCVAGFSVTAVLVVAIIASLSLKLTFVMLLGLILVNFLASSSNSVLTSIYPLFMRDVLSSGMIAGVLNGFCYLGSTLSSYGLGAIADAFGWTSVFFALVAFCGVTVILGALYLLAGRVLTKKER